MRKIEFLSEKYIDMIANNIRESDRKEVYASHHITDMKEALMNCLALSHESWVWVVDDEPICVFGVSPGSYLTKQGIPWLLATEKLNENIHSFIINSKIIVDYWKTKWDLLYNYVDASNEASIRWLKYLGFTIDEPAPYGMERLNFRRFHMKGRPYV